MAEELRLNIVSTADSKGFEKAVKDMSEAKAEAGKLSDEFAKTGQNAEDLDQSVGDATKSIKTHSEQVRVLRAEYEKTTKRIAELDAQLLGGGDSKAIKKDLREQRAWLAEIQKVAREVQRTSGISFKLGNDDSPVVTGVLEGILNGIPKLGGLDPRLIAGGAALGAALAPGLSAALGGAVIGTAGAGGIVGGTLLAARDPRVQAGFTELKDIFLETMKPAGDAFVQPVLASIDILEKELQKGRLAAALAAAAPLTERFAKGIAGFVNEASDGLKTLFDRSGPLFELWQQEMPETGQAIGYFFSAISTDAGGAAKGLDQFFDVLQVGVKTTGDAIGGLTILNDLLQNPFIGKGMEKIPLDGTLGAINRFANGPEIQKAGEAMTGFTIKTNENRDALMAEAIAEQTAARKAQDLAIAQADAALKGRDLKAAWDELHGAAMSLDEAYKRAYDGLAQVTQAFRGSDDSIKGFSQGAVERRTALQEEADKAIAVAQAYYDMTGDADGAQKKLDEFKKKAEDATQTTGNARKEVDKLADALFRLPEERKIFVTTYYRNSFEADFRAGERDSSGRPPTTGIGTRASGGPVKANVPYMINERGRETVTFPAGGQVHPANLTPIGNARPLVITPTGNAFMDGAFEWLRTEISARGGTLAVLGIRG